MFYHLGKKSSCDLHFKVTSLDVQIGQQPEPEPYENGRYLSVETLNTIITAYPKLRLNLLSSMKAMSCEVAVGAASSRGHFFP